MRPEAGHWRDEVVARLGQVAAYERRTEMMAHGRCLRGKEQTIDSRLFHALELSLHRVLQLLVADLELGPGRLTQIGDLAAPVGLQLGGSRSVVGVGVNDHT